MNILCSRETTGQKYCMSKKTGAKDLSNNGFCSKIGVKTAEISQFEESRFRDLFVGCFLVSTECDFVLFSDAKSNHRTKSD